MTKQDFVKQYKEKRELALKFYGTDEAMFLLYDIEPLIEDFLGIELPKD